VRFRKPWNTQYGSDRAVFSEQAQPVMRYFYVRKLSCGMLEWFGCSPPFGRTRNFIEDDNEDNVKDCGF
jgi:hypothetical protein